MMNGRSLRAPLIVLFVLAAALVALAGGAHAGSIPGPIMMPPVGAARPTMPDAPGTITTPVTPTVPPSPTPGKSTITIPDVSGSGAASTRNPRAVRPCGMESGAAGAIPGNAGIATAPGANPNNTATGIPNIPSGGSGAPSSTTTNPSVRPGVPSSC